MLGKASSSYSYFEILDACQKPGCPVCSLGHTAARRNLNTLIYEGVNDYVMRAKLRESLGYCHEHAWLLPEAGESAALGIAIVHRDLLNNVRRRLEEIKFDKGQKKKFRTFLAGAISLDDGTVPDPRSAKYLAPAAPCPACKNRDKIENLALKSLIDALEKRDEKMVAGLEASDGLCVPHLRRALEESRSADSFDALITLSQNQISGLIQELDEFIRKNDHRFRDEKILDRERESWRRALQLIVGPKN